MSAPVHHRVASQATALPDAPALVCGSAVLTYRELDERANRLAHYLVDLGVAPDSRVAVQLPRSADMVVVLLAVLKAGGAFLPVDPAQPPARIEHVLADAAPAILVTAGAEAAPGPVPGGAACHTHVDLTRDAAAITACPARDPHVPVFPDHLAYVIHTSGSTGAPKGVMVPHSGLANLVDWHVGRYRIGPGDRTSHVAALGFDASVWEVWPALTAGAALHLPREQDRAQPERLLAWLAAEGITVAFLPTPVAEEVLRLLTPPSALRTVLTGGDALTAAPPPGTPYELVNHYGPTEASVVTTAAAVPAGGSEVPSIGSSIAGVRVHLLDEDAQRVPDGAPGEICVGGAGVARGYLGRPGLTAERFVPDPYGPPGSRVYRTGDLAGRRPDGALDFQGRSDDQVQIRGFRVEPTEVAAALFGHPEVARAAVTVRSGRLLGYVVPRSGDGEGLPEAVRAHVAARLPEHMVPAGVLVLAEIPLTVNGKVDRDALPDQLPPAPHTVVAPRDAVEELTAEIWYDVLELPDRPAHVHDDFYALGGHSLQANRLTVRLRDLFGVDLPLQAVFNGSTIAELAGEIRTLEPAPGHLAEVAARHRQVAELSDEEVQKLLAELEGG